jgi:molybdenum cofactor guanylyltransferase
MSVTALTLAGGQGSRMGGADKGWVEWQGKALVEHVLAQLVPQSTQQLISANRNLERYAQLGVPVVQDLRDGFAGPLAAIEAGLAVCETDWLLTCPVDTLNIPPDYAQRMLAVRPSVASKAGRLQPVFMLIHKDSLPDLRAFLDAGERKVGLWAERQGLRHVSFDDQPNALLNLNDWQALQQAQQ